MQRLFSTFADGWPGAGLLLQRFLTAAVLLHCGIDTLGGTPPSLPMILHLLGAMAGIFLLLGLWTPVAGTSVAIFELWLVFAHAGNPWISVLLSMLGATLAMIGPGAWSVDARLFGRKYIHTPER